MYHHPSFCFDRSASSVLLRHRLKMSVLSLSEAERTFIIHGVQDDLRADGRHRDDFRHFARTALFVTVMYFHIVGIASFPGILIVKM